MTANRFLQALGALAQRCNYKLSEFDFELYSAEGEKMGWDVAVNALTQIYRDMPAGGRFPALSELAQRANPAGLSDEEQAREGAALISEAIQRHGWNRPDKAQEMIGSVGWRVVEMSGGWQAICQELTYDNMAILKAQWRELALGQIRKAKAGVDGPPMLAEEPHLKLVADLAKLVEKK